MLVLVLLLLLLVMSSAAPDILLYYLRKRELPGPANTLADASASALAARLLPLLLLAAAVVCAADLLSLPQAWPLMIICPLPARNPLPWLLLWYQLVLPLHRRQGQARPHRGSGLRS